MPKETKISQEQMDDFLAEIMDLNISEKSAEFAKMLIYGNAWMAQQLELGQLSIAKPSRKPQNDPASSGNKSANPELASKGHGRNSADAYQGASIIEVEHPELNPGDTCPAEECDGRLYEMTEPGTLVRVTGAPFTLQPTEITLCNL